MFRLIYEHGENQAMMVVALLEQPKEAVSPDVAYKIWVNENIYKVIGDVSESDKLAEWREKKGRIVKSIVGDEPFHLWFIENVLVKKYRYKRISYETDTFKTE